MLGNDESTYYANCDQTYFWGDDLTNVIKQKSLGSSLMGSDFVDETVGFLQDNLAEARITLATSRNGYFNNELVTLHLIPVSSDLNLHICAHTMLKAWGTQKWPCSL